MRFAVFIFLFSVSGAFGQYHEIGFMINQAGYIGEINQSSHIPTEFQPGGALIYRYNINDRMAFKANVLFARIYAHDKDSDSEWQNNRNLHFRSDIFELSGQIEINFLTYEIGDKQRPSSPYVFLGFSIFRFNPQAEFNDRWVDLQPLGTEGQSIAGFEERYPLTQVSIPFGVGFKFNIWKNFGGAIEWGFRRTFTDYLDDVSGTYVDAALLEEENGPLSAIMADRSFLPNGPDGTNTGMQRGETNRKDYYTIAGLMITYKIGKARIKCPSAWN
jgi:hypothetical protein